MAEAKKTSSKSGGTRGTASRKRATKKASAPRDVAAATLDAALALAAKRSWADIALAEIAEEAGLKLSEIYPVFPTKGAILAAFSRRIDGLVLSEDLEGLDDSPARDRLFDVMMRRFDALEPYRDAVGNILADLWSDPVSALGGLPQLSRSMGWMLEAAAVPPKDGAACCACRGWSASTWQRCGSGCATTVRTSPRLWLSSTPISAGSKRCRSASGVEAIHKKPPKAGSKKGGLKPPFSMPDRVRCCRPDPADRTVATYSAATLSSAIRLRST